MTVRYKTNGFVFKKNDVNESDKVFSVFTEDFGRLDIFAKAIRKNASKLRNGIDIFNMVEIEFIQGKNKKTLTDAVAIEKFNNIPQGLERFKIANAIGEILDNSIKGEEKDRDIFNLLKEAFVELNGLNLEKGKRARIFYYFLWSIICLLGYKPEVEKCSACKEEISPQDIYFSNKFGGIICGNCVKEEKTYPCQGRKINSDIVKILRIIFKKEWLVISRLKIEPASQALFREISDNYYSYVLSK